MWTLLYLAFGRFPSLNFSSFPTSLILKPLDSTKAGNRQKFLNSPFKSIMIERFFGRVICCNPEIVCHCFYLLCGNSFEHFVGARQPYFFDIMQHIFVWLVFVFAVALQDFPVLQRALNRYERSIRFLYFSDKEEKRFLAHHGRS